MAESDVEIWFKIQKTADGYPSSQEWEQLFAWPVEGCFRIDSIPFFVKGVAVGDLVCATRTEDGLYKFAGLRSSSGHSTFRIWLAESISNRDQIVNELKALGTQVETTFEGRLLAIDISPEHEAEVWDYLRAGKEPDAGTFKLVARQIDISSTRGIRLAKAWRASSDRQSPSIRRRRRANQKRIGDGRN